MTIAKNTGQKTEKHCRTRDSSLLQLQKCAKALWPKGLLRVGDTFRFRRMIHRRKLFQTIGEVSESEAICRAVELNALLKSGRPVTRSTLR